MKRSERAMQVWQILVAAAHNRQSLTYGHVTSLRGQVFPHHIKVVLP